MIPKDEWEWFGHPGHFICARDCQFHLCTRVGAYLISTVGEMVPDSEVREIYAKMEGAVLEGRGNDRLADYMRKVGFRDIGFGRKYETMVFKAGKPCNTPDCNCGLPLPTDYTELDARGANTPGEARAFHLELCEKYAGQE